MASMPSLTTIFRDPNANPHGTTVERQAVGRLSFKVDNCCWFIPRSTGITNFPVAESKKGKSLRMPYDVSFLRSAGRG